jgi:uncharacterized delta-60 repeat protein
MNPDSHRRSKWRWSLSGLLLLLAVWGILPGETWLQTHQQEPPDSGPVREPVFVIDDVANAVALQRDGKIVAAGVSDRSFALVRYLSSGEVDFTFGTKGKVKTRLGAAEDIEDALTDMALQADGKTVVVGRVWTGLSNDLAVVRYNPDGNLDPSFGRQGVVTTDFTSPDMPRYLGPSYDEASALLIQADGKLVVGGTSLVRYNPDGSLDASFGVGGRVRTVARALALQRDGKLVAIGAAEGTFALARYYPDGSVDSSFGTDGVVISQISRVDAANDMALQTDGKLVVVGQAFDGRRIDFAMVRYHPDGTLDHSFGTGGKVTSDFCAHQIEEQYAQHVGLGTIQGGGWRVGVQTDGKIVVTGTPSNVLCSGSVMFRYNSDGSLDTTFGESGRVTTAMTRNDGSFGAQVIQDDGKIVVVGTSGKGFAVARYNPDGTLDHTFGTGGKVTTRIGTGYTVW